MQDVPDDENGHPAVMHEVSFSVKPAEREQRSDMSSRLLQTFPDRLIELTSSIETQAHDYFGRFYIIPPQQIHRQGYLSQIGVCIDNRPDPWVVGVPGPI